jgi:ABC-type branched-subunit amino acid transport system ATPase component
MAYERDFDFEAHLDRVLDVARGIRPGEVTILTGPNGYGKSLVRKVLPAALAGHGYEGKVCSFSMERRTSPNEGFSALRSLAMDQVHDATSNHTCAMTLAVLRDAAEHGKYVVLDEPETGMGKEVLLGLISRIRGFVDERKAAGNFRGLLVVTHSEFVVDNLPHDHFANLEGLTREQWKSRELVPVDPEDLSAWCHSLYLTIERRNKQKKN